MLIDQVQLGGADSFVVDCFSYPQFHYVHVPVIYRGTGCCVFSIDMQKSAQNSLGRGEEVDLADNEGGLFHLAHCSDC